MKEPETKTIIDDTSRNQLIFLLNDSRSAMIFVMVVLKNFFSNQTKLQLNTEHKDSKRANSNNIKRERIQRSGHKTAKSQNSDCYKMAKSQNSDCYKTETVTKQQKIIYYK